MASFLKIGISEIDRYIINRDMVTGAKIKIDAQKKNLYWAVSLNGSIINSQMFTKTEKEQMTAWYESLQLNVDMTPEIDYWFTQIT